MHHLIVDPKYHQVERDASCMSMLPPPNHFQPHNSIDDDNPKNEILFLITIIVSGRFDRYPLRILASVWAGVRDSQGITLASSASCPSVAVTCMVDRSLRIASDTRCQMDKSCRTQIMLRTKTIVEVGESPINQLNI